MERRFGAEALRGIINAKAIIFSIPAAAIVLLLMYLCASLTQTIGLPMALSFLLIVFLTAPITGLYGILSRDGDFGSGLGKAWSLRGEIASFTFRYWALAFVWAGAASVAGIWIFSSGAAGGVLLNAGEFSFALRSIGFSAWMLFVITFSALSLAVSLASDGVDEAFSPSVWARVLGGKRGDVRALFALTAGGMVLYYFIVFPFVILLIMAVFKINPLFGVFANKFGKLVPFAFAPVIFGRLCGAFVGGVSEDAGLRPERNLPPARAARIGPSASTVAPRPKTR